MSEAESPAAPAAGTSAQNQPAATDAAVAAPAAQATQDDPNWLPARLERERKAIAKRFGAESLDDIDARLKKLGELEVERMSEAERLQTRIKQLEPLESETKALREAVSAMAKRELASLTEAQRAIVEDLTGGDAAKALAVIEKLRPTWAQQPAPIAPAAPPANTAPAAPAPQPVSPMTENHLATWERMRAENPMAAANYYLTHQRSISDARKQRVAG